MKLLVLLLVSPGSLHMNMGIENIVYTEFTKKKVFEQLPLAAEKYRSQNAVTEVPQTLPFKMSLTRKWKYSKS